MVADSDVWVETLHSFCPSSPEDGPESHFVSDPSGQTVFRDVSVVLVGNDGS